ncbi:hypothetical protein SO802_014234 [Lithocarpus litseifolius]|uniref:Fe-S metabolism associated domain-containing protein n=1 Tax=Lithocarpus litseifolius TaxID=425828 RepID=A0AAW2CQE9_9ROSI
MKCINREFPTTPSSSSSSPSPSPSPSTSSSVPLQPIEELPPKLQEIVKPFQSVQEPNAKYEQLLYYDKNLKPLKIQFKTKDNKVEGCVSQVWVRAYLDSDNNVVFEADSDSVLTKGLAALLVNGLSGRPVNEVIQVSPDFVVLLGLQQSLAPTRSNAFLNMLRLMQKKALQLAVEAEKGKNLGLKMDGSVENVNFGLNFDLGVEEILVGVSNLRLKVDSRDGNVNVELDSEVGGARSPVQSSNLGGLGSRGMRIVNSHCSDLSLSSLVSLGVTPPLSLPPSQRPAAAVVEESRTTDHCTHHLCRASCFDQIFKATTVIVSPRSTQSWKPCSH